MTETLWAVVIGGLVSAGTTMLISLLTNLFEYRKWRREKRLEHLTERKARAETAIVKLTNFIGTPNVNVPMEDLIYIHAFPKKIRESVRDLENLRAEPADKQDKERIDLTVDFIFSATHRFLEELDGEIEKLLS
jgi:hypothetical protein